MLSAIRCWNFGHSDTSIGSEWLCRAEMILESYAKVDSNQFKTGNTPQQLVQCSTVPNNKKLQICKSTWYPSLINRNSSRAKQPLSRVNLPGFKMENIYLFEIIKRFGTFFKTWLCPNFSCCTQKFWKCYPGLQPPPTHPPPPTSLARTLMNFT